MNVSRTLVVARNNQITDRSHQAHIFILVQLLHSVWRHALITLEVSVLLVHIAVSGTSSTKGFVDSTSPASVHSVELDHRIGITSYLASTDLIQNGWPRTRCQSQKSKSTNHQKKSSASRKSGRMNSTQRKRSGERDSREVKVASAEDGVGGEEVVEEAVAGQNVVVSDRTKSVVLIQVRLSQMESHCLCLLRPTFDAPHGIDWLTQHNLPNRERATFHSSTCVSAR